MNKQKEEARDTKKVNIADKNKELENSMQNETLIVENEDYSKQIETLTATNLELEDMLKRRVAEFENYKRRTDKEKIDLLEYGSSKLIAKFADLLDDLSNATEAAKNTNDIESVVKGLEMITQKTTKLFADEGVTKMDINVGDEFNVDMHEALMTQPSNLPEGCITMIMQDGYMYKEKVIRYAKVATSAGN